MAVELLTVLRAARPRDAAAPIGSGPRRNPRRRPLGEHTVEQVIARLRADLGAPEVIQTVVKRGYRLLLEQDTDGMRCLEA